MITRAWVIVNEKTGKPVLWEARLQVFWRKSVAEEKCRDFGEGKVVRCEVSVT